MWHQEFIKHINFRFQWPVNNSQSYMYAFIDLQSSHILYVYPVYFLLPQFATLPIHTHTHTTHASHVTYNTCQRAWPPASTCVLHPHIPIESPATTIWPFFFTAVDGRRKKNRLASAGPTRAEPMEPCQAPSTSAQPCSFYSRFLLRANILSSSLCPSSGSAYVYYVQRLLHICLSFCSIFLALCRRDVIDRGRWCMLAYLLVVTSMEPIRVHTCT